MAKGPFKCNEVKDLEMGRLSGISQVGQCNHMTLVKKEDGGSESERETALRCIGSFEDAR